ncbi:MAG: hypothetical protein A2Z20_03585 [Bdellovibrionales bacterium RBG_16_40_8]|nr:MAG: hypothetical protein A2Z20_03585 [Bdellovibrionales bacterium RBG_16_40_8]
MGVDHYITNLSASASAVVAFAEARNKIAAVTEFGATTDGIDDSTNANYYMDFLTYIKNDAVARKVAWVLTWRNGSPTHYWVPRIEDIHYDGFLKFFNDPFTAFENDIGDYYSYNFGTSIAPFCGLRGCEAGETCSSCPGDCGLCLMQKQDPIAHWQFDDASGATALDSSGNGNTGMLVNGPSWATASENNSLRFDGLNDMVSVEDGPLLSFTNTFTLSAWINLSAVDRSQSIISKGKCNINWVEYALEVGSDNKPRVFFSEKSADNQIVVASTALGPNTWYHIVGTYDGSAERIFVDGTLSGSLYTNHAMFDSTANLTIGARETDGSTICSGDNTVKELSGSIDDVRIYNRALTAEEIKSLYNAGASGTTSGARVSRPQHPTGLTAW